MQLLINAKRTDLQLLAVAKKLGVSNCHQPLRQAMRLGCSALGWLI